MINNVKACGTGYIMRRQVCRKGLLHHEKVGCPNAPNLIASGAGGEGISGVFERGNVIRLFVNGNGDQNFF
jgi:hypothetical protein